MKNGNSKLFKIVSVAFVFILAVITASCNSDKPKSPAQAADVQQAAAAVKTRYADDIFSSVDTEKDILFSEAKNYKGENEKLLLNVYKPAGDTETNRPAIIWLHGGGFTNGSKDKSMFEQDLAIEFAKKGYVTLNINYRLRDSTTGSGFGVIQDAVDDAAAAIKWLTANSEKYGVDKTHIALGGYSAGATTVIHTCYSNLSKYGIEKSNIFSAIDLAGGRLHGSVKKDDPPCIIVNGTNDNTVPYYTAEEFEAQLSAAGVYNVLYPIEGSDHDLKGGYDDLANQVTKFLYKNLTGKDITIAPKQGKSHEYLKVDERIAKGKSYNAKQIDFKIDGKLDEWRNSEIINLDQLKDTGSSLPDKDDFSGTFMVGWNEKDPNRVYMAAAVTDDIIQDINSAGSKWFNDDCLEIAFDLSMNDFAAPITKFALGTTGKDLSMLGNKKNTEYSIVKDGNKYIFEIAFDFSKMNADVNKNKSKYSIKANDIIGFSPSYNDCENKIREHQIGWIAGQASSRASFGNIRFVTDKAQ